VGDTGCLTNFSIDGEHCLDTSSEATQSHSNVLRVDSNGRVLQKPYRGLSPLVFDLPPNPSIDSLVPVILLECEGRSGEDGAQATTEFIV
jgi:hypothetical protein